MQKIATYLVLIIFLHQSFTGTAQTNTWFGGNGNWNDPTKWSTGNVPGITDSVVINSGIVTGNFFLVGQTPDTIRIKSLTLNGGILETGSYLVLSSTFLWSGGRFRGSPEPQTHLYDGGVVDVRHYFNIEGSMTVDSLVMVNKSMTMRGGGNWNELPNFILRNSEIRMVPNDTFYIQSVNVSTHLRDGQITGIDNPLHPVPSYLRMIARVMDKTGSKRFTMATPWLFWSDNNFLVTEGRFTVIIKDSLEQWNDVIDGENNTTTDFILDPGPNNHYGAIFHDLGISSPDAVVNVIADGPNVTNHTLTMWAGIGADTLNVQSKYNNEGKPTVSISILNPEHFELTGPINVRGGSIRNYTHTDSQTINCFEILDIWNSTIAGGSFGGYRGIIRFSDTVNFVGPDTIKLNGTTLRIGGYTKFKNANIAIGSQPVTYHPFGGSIPPASNNYANSRIEISRGGMLELEIDSTSKVYCHWPISPRPFQASLHNWGTMKLTNPAGAAPHTNFNIDIPFIDSGNITGAFVDVNTQDFTWTGPGNLSGRININTYGQFYFYSYYDWINPNNTKLTTAKINIYGPQNFFQRGGIDINASGGILTNYGSITTLCNEGDVYLFNTSGDDKGYFSNYGQMYKKGVNSTITFESKILLKNGRDLIIERGTMKALGAFNNINLVRGYGVLDVSQATSFSNTGIFTGGITMTGIYTVKGNYDNATLLADIKGDNPMGGPPADKLIVTGNADISASMLRVRERGNVPTPSSFVVLECLGGPGCLTGTFSTTELPAGYSVSYTGNSVIVNKGTSLTLRNTASEETVSTHSFKVFKISEKTYRIETSGKKAEISIFDLNGKLVKKVTIGNYYTAVNLQGLAPGVLIAYNSSTNEQVKFLVD